MPVDPGTGGEGFGHEGPAIPEGGEDIARSISSEGRGGSGYGLPARVPFGFGGLVQLVVLGVTGIPPVASRPALAEALAALLATGAFLALGAAAQRNVSGSARLVWSVWGAFWCGLGFWVVSVPISLVSPLPVTTLAPPAAAFAYPFPFTGVSFDVARDLAAVLVLSLGSGLAAGVGGLAYEWVWDRRNEEAAQRH